MTTNKKKSRRCFDHWSLIRHRARTCARVGPPYSARTASAARNRLFGAAFRWRNATGSPLRKARSAARTAADSVARQPLLAQISENDEPLQLGP